MSADTAVRDGISTTSATIDRSGALRAYVARILDSAPPLTHAQRDALVILVRGGAS